MLEDLIGPPQAMTIDSVAGRLREGPLRTMLTLQIRAGTLVAVAANDRQRLERLVELLQLARMATTQFEHFTAELQDLVDELTASQQSRPKS